MRLQPPPCSGLKANQAIRANCDSIASYTGDRPRITYDADAVQQCACIADTDRHCGPNLKSVLEVSIATTGAFATNGRGSVI